MDHSSNGVTEVKTDAPHATLYHHVLNGVGVSSFIHRGLLKGNAGQLDYKRLEKHKDNRPHESYTITSAVGSTVGVHEFMKEDTDSDIILLFAHGNTRPTCYCPEIMESLLASKIKGVVGRDFVGYDASSQIPFQDGAVELAAHANDMAFLGHMTQKYPSYRFILFGRSIGTWFWAAHLQHPKVVGAIGLVPLTSAKAGVEAYIGQWMAPAVTASAFPSGCSSPKLPEFTTNGFEMESINQGAKGKLVMLFPATNDTLVSQSDLEKLQSNLQAAGCKTQTEFVMGDHTAIPSASQLAIAVDRIAA